MRLFKSHSSRQTKNFAVSLVKKYARPRRLGKRRALVFALSGDLGSGKTTFVQGFLRALGVKQKITSPTFIIIKKFEVRSTKPETIPNIQKLKFKTAYHIDCYRIKKPKELIVLGLKEILNNPRNIVLIEWAEKIKKILRKNSIWLEFEHEEKENQRIIRISKNFE